MIESFETWLAREMPAGTVIGDPAWWAPRILRKAQLQVDPAEMSNWIAVEKQMPTAGVTVLVYFVGDYGHKGIAVARHIPQYFEKCDDNCDLDTEYQESNDTYYHPAGWYEQVQHWGDYSQIEIHSEVLYWMALPKLPNEVTQ